MTKKILFIVDVFPSVSQTFIVNQIVSLIKKGHLVQIYSYQKGTDSKVHEVVIENNLLNLTTFHEDMPAGKKLRLLNLIRWIVNNFSKIDWNEFYKIIRQKDFFSSKEFLHLFYESKWFLLRKNRTHILHAHFGPNAERIAYLKSKGILGYAKLISTFHGYDLMPSHLHNYKNDYSYLFKFSDVITVNTIYSKSLLFKINSKLENVSILPVSLDTTFFRRDYALKDQSFTIVYCGRLIPLKGPNLAIDILKELLDRGNREIDLKIIGTGIMYESLSNKVEKLGINNYVTFYGELSQESIKYHLNTSSVLIMPGTYDPESNRVETQGLVIQEAQAMELPVIVSNVGGMKYGLIPNKTGLVIEVNNIQAFADGIEILNKDGDLRQSMGKMGREFVVKNYDSSILASQLLKLYR